MKRLEIIIASLLCFIEQMAFAQVAEMKPEIVVLNDGGDYQYSIRLNGEPIYSAGGPSFFDWAASPLRMGSNELNFTAMPLPGTRGKADFDVNVVDTIQARIGGGQIPFDNTNLINETFSFSLSQMPKHLNLEQFSADHVTLRKQLTEISFEIIKGFSKSDPAAMGRLLGLDKSAITNGYPGWFWDRSKRVNEAAIGKADDIEILIGGKIAIARPCFSYFQKFPRAGLFSKTEPESGVRITRDCLVFCQLNKQICMFSSIDNSIPIPVRAN